MLILQFANSGHAGTDCSRGNINVVAVRFSSSAWSCNERNKSGFNEHARAGRPCGEKQHFHVNRHMGTCSCYMCITAEEIIKHTNDSQRTIVLPSLVLVCVLLLLGIPGFFFAVHVYAFKMNRSTSGYFIMTLAISDLITCAISLPVETALILNFWSFDWTTLCKCSRYISAAMNNTFSFILAAIAVTVWRYFAQSICH